MAPELEVSAEPRLVLGGVGNPGGVVTFRGGVVGRVGEYSPIGILWRNSDLSVRSDLGEGRTNWSSYSDGVPGMNPGRSIW